MIKEFDFCYMLSIRMSLSTFCHALERYFGCNSMNTVTRVSSLCNFCTYICLSQNNINVHKYGEY